VTPTWYHNIMASGAAEVELGTDRYPVGVRELHDGERDRVWAEQVRRYPGFGEYERLNAGVRLIPVIELTRAAPAGDA
jgi:deazaflavin-dependent oxidoreductase (nitroreductase family)